MQRRLKECKKWSFWDVHKKKGGGQEDIIVGLRCPFWNADCRHREKKEGKPFCMNYPLHDEIREGNKEGPKNPEPGEKAA